MYKYKSCEKSITLEIYLYITHHEKNIHKTTIILMRKNKNIAYKNQTYFIYILNYVMMIYNVSNFVLLINKNRFFLFDISNFIF